MGHIKVLSGPYVARGPDVAQACSAESKYQLCLKIESNF